MFNATTSTDTFKYFSYEDKYRLHGFYPNNSPGKPAHFHVYFKAQRNNGHTYKKMLVSSTLSDANEKHDRCICIGFGKSLTQTASNPYAVEDLAQVVDSTVYAHESTTIDLCISAFYLGRAS
jgi:hypothetical protein